MVDEFSLMGQEVKQSPICYVLEDLRALEGEGTTSRQPVSPGLLDGAAGLQGRRKDHRSTNSQGE